ncbi:unnamed protein product [Phaedon cochleariae]|uniref:DUF4806 domain-containing protein n=1 Tax=Phaedon cochleariae TaxID=80249 RepID=A0A9N9SCU6_PHACE|nr:unnamed protein product [Phaedon cochleariae]
MESYASQRSRKYWRVVHFISEDSVEAVPMNWIINKVSCYWPQQHLLKVAIPKCLPPENSWKIHSIRIIGEIYDDLVTAKIKASKAMYTSDINSDVEKGIGHRKKKANSKYTLDLYDSDETNIDIDLDESRDESNIERSVLLSPRNSKHHMIEAEKTDDLEVPILTPRNTMIPNYSNIRDDSDEELMSNIIAEADDNNHNASRTNADKSTVTPKKISEETGFEKLLKINFNHVFRQLSLINFKLDEVIKDMNSGMLQTTNEVDIAESFFTKFEFPISTLEDLNDFEAYLKNDENKIKVTKELSSIGGSSHKIMVKRIMDKVLSNEVGQSFSWLGFKMKKNFSVLLISQVIIDAVISLKTMKVTRADVEASIKFWLLKSKERREKELNQ